MVAGTQVINGLREMYAFPSQSGYFYFLFAILFHQNVAYGMMTFDPCVTYMLQFIYIFYIAASHCPTQTVFLMFGQCSKLTEKSSYRFNPAGNIDSLSYLFQTAVWPPHFVHFIVQKYGNILVNILVNEPIICAWLAFSSRELQILNEIKYYPCLAV